MVLSQLYDLLNGGNGGVSRLLFTILNLPCSRSTEMNYLLVLLPLGRPRRRWEDNIKMDLQEVGYEGMDMYRYVSG
jgi:hypothetical protein